MIKTKYWLDLEITELKRRL